MGGVTGVTAGDPQAAISPMALASNAWACLVIGISSDDLFPVRETHEMIERMQQRGVDITSFIVESSYGHDAFLVEVDEQTELVRGFLGSTLKERR